MKGEEEGGIHNTLSVSDNKAVFPQPGTRSSATVQGPAQKPHCGSSMFKALWGAVVHPIASGKGDSEA